MMASSKLDISYRLDTGLLDDLAYSAISFWHKLQLSHFLQLLPPATQFTLQLTPFELLCSEKFTAVSYDLTGLSLSSSLSKWEEDLGITLWQAG